MATRRILKCYNVENISGADIELVTCNHYGKRFVFIFEKNEVIHGVTEQAINNLKFSNPGILDFVQLHEACEVWEYANEWLEEGF